MATARAASFANLFVVSYSNVEASAPPTEVASGIGASALGGAISPVDGATSVVAGSVGRFPSAAGPAPASAALSSAVVGRGAEATPVYPDFLTAEEPKEFFIRIIERLMHAFDTGEMICSGHDYRQALEIAIALKHSAARNHRRIALPLEDRTLKIYPHPYRHTGGDVAGWESIGYAGPPELPN